MTICRIASLSWIVLILVSASPSLARTWTDSSGTHKIEGEFVNLTDGNVDIRRDDGNVVRVPLGKLSEQDRKYVQMAASDRKGSHFIEAEGTGTTSEEALKDAFRAAVRQVVGAYVDEDTCVENDEVIKDQVLTHSRGCIESYEQLSQKAEDGVTHVTIRAVVKPDEVVSCLRKANVAMTDLSGEQFWAKVTSQRQQERDAESLLRKALDGFPENCLKAEPIGEPRQDHDEAVTRLGITVRVAVVPQAYQTFSTELRQVLDQIAKRKPKQETETTFERQANSELPVLYSTASSSEKFILALLGVVHHSTLPHGLSSKARSKKGPSPPKYSFDVDVGEDLVLALNTQVTNSGTQLKWKRYLLDKRLRPLLTEVVSRKLFCQVMLVNATGSQVVAQGIPSKTKKVRDREKFPVTLFGSYWGTRGGTRELKVALVSQVFFNATRITEQMPDLSYDCVFDLTDAELRSVKQTRCKLSMIEADNDTTRPKRKSSGNDTTRPKPKISGNDATQPKPKISGFGR